MLKGIHRHFIVKAWGNGLDGQLGTGPTCPQVVKTPTLTLLPPSQAVLQIGAGITHSVALIKQNNIGKLYAWGCNFFGQSGHFPQLSNSLFEDDDNIVQPQHLNEGIYNDDISDLCVGYFHQLALSNKGSTDPNKKEQLYAWGSGVLGNGSDLFSAEPVKIKMPDNRKIISMHISGNTSAVVLDYNGLPEIYIWGYFLQNSELVKALSPIRLLELGSISNIKSFSITNCLVAIYGRSISQEDVMVVLGEIANLDMNKPYCPNVLEVRELQKETNIKMHSTWKEPNIKSVELHSNSLLLLYNDGNVKIRSLIDGSYYKLDFNGCYIESMKISTNSAIFKSKSRVFTYIAPDRPLPLTQSLWKTLFTSSDAVIDKSTTKSLLECMKSEKPTQVEIECADLISCGWNHFLVSSSAI